MIVSTSNSVAPSTVKYFAELFQLKTVPVVFPSFTSSPLLNALDSSVESKCGNHLDGTNEPAELIVSKLPGHSTSLRYPSILYLTVPIPP